jgi:hypothetical protein
MTRTKKLADPSARVRDLITRGVGELDKQLSALVKGKPDASKATRLGALLKDAAALLGHLRRYDQAQREATRELSIPIVIAFLRALPADKRRMIIRESDADEDEDADDEGVLS